jgi:hypothetical protein
MNSGATPSASNNFSAIHQWKFSYHSKNQELKKISMVNGYFRLEKANITSSLAADNSPTVEDQS